MSNILHRVRVAFLTAQRAGFKRSAARVRRVFLLRAVYPRFAARLYPSRPQKIPSAVTALPPLLVREQTPWNGSICLLHTAPFGMQPPVAWDANPIRSTLWQFRLHEWEWAYPLIDAAQANPQARTDLVALVRDYITRVPFGHPLAFEPYPLSRRLVLWCEALRVLAAANTEVGFLQQLSAEMARGARMLAQNLEHDLDNNHIIANAKALAFVGTLLEIQPLAARGFTCLWEQLRLQVRADGMHVENSTTYHFLVWRDAVETCILAEAYHIPIPPDILPRLAAMSGVLRTLQYADGTFPLLNDSVQDEFVGLDRLEGASERLSDSRLPQNTNVFDASSSSQTLLSHSGLAILRAPDAQVIFDAGALGPAYCPGHGHADTLSFELFALGQLRLVDPGTYQYQVGEWRDYFRGTAAHNTLQVDGLDSSEVSAAFRVGTMANARMWVDGEWVCGEHDGYMRLSEPITHTRKLQLRSDCTLLLYDEIRGRGEHTYVLRFHLAPNAHVTLTKNKARIGFADTVRMDLEIFNAQGALAVISGWHSPTWYTKRAAPVLEYRWRGKPPFEISTTITLRPNST